MSKIKNRVQTLSRQNKMRYKIIEEYTTNQKLRYYVEYKYKWFPFWFYAKDCDYVIRSILKFNSFSDAKNWINEDKINREEIKRNNIEIV